MTRITQKLITLFLLAGGAFFSGLANNANAATAGGSLNSAPALSAQSIGAINATSFGAATASPAPTGIKMAQNVSRPRTHRKRGSSGGLTGFGIGLIINLAPRLSNPPSTRNPPGGNKRPAAGNNKPPRKTVRKRPARKKIRKRRPAFVINGRIRPREVLVLIKNSRKPGLEDEFARRHRLDPLESRSIGLLGARLQKYRIRGKRSVARVVAAMRRDRRAFLVQPNYLYLMSGSKAAGKAGNPQYALNKLNVALAHKLSKGRDVTVAVIDAGVDDAHPALREAVIQQFNAVSNTPFKAEPHGTGVAGIIAGRGEVQGVAPLAKVLAISAFYRNAKTRKLETSSFILLRAIDHAYNNGARIMNLSFAGPDDPALAKIIKAAHAKGAILVAAAGNGGPKAGAAYPAAYREVIAVTATDHRDRLYAKANRGKYLTLAAPGVDVLAPAPDNGYAYQSGTSFAAAHVSGLIALLLARNPQLDDRAIRRAITMGAHDLGPRGKDPIFGAGRADAFTTLKRLDVTH